MLIHPAKFAVHSNSVVIYFPVEFRGMKVVEPAWTVVSHKNQTRTDKKCKRS